MKKTLSWEKETERKQLKLPTRRQFSLETSKKKMKKKNRKKKIEIKKNQKAKHDPPEKREDRQQQPLHGPD